MSHVFHQPWSSHFKVNIDDAISSSLGDVEFNLSFAWSSHHSRCLSYVFVFNDFNSFAVLVEFMLVRVPGGDVFVTSDSNVLTNFEVLNGRKIITIKLDSDGSLWHSSIRGIISSWSTQLNWWIWNLNIDFAWVKVLH